MILSYTKRQNPQIQIQQNLASPCYMYGIRQLHHINHVTIALPLANNTAAPPRFHNLKHRERGGGSVVAISLYTYTSPLKVYVHKFIGGGDTHTSSHLPGGCKRQGKAKIDIMWTLHSRKSGEMTNDKIHIILWAMHT